MLDEMPSKKTLQPESQWNPATNNYTPATCLAGTQALTAHHFTLLEGNTSCISCQSHMDMGHSCQPYVTGLFPLYLLPFASQWQHDDPQKGRNR